MFKPKVNSIKKSGKVVGVPPDYPEFAEARHKQGAPARKSSLHVVRPGGK